MTKLHVRRILIDATMVIWKICAILISIIIGSKWIYIELYHLAPQRWDLIQTDKIFLQYVFIVFLGFFSFLTIPILKNSLLRWVLSTALLIGVVVDYSVSSLINGPVMISTLSAFWDAKAEAGDALETYAGYILACALLYAMLLVGFVSRPRKIALPVYWSLLLVFAFAATFAMVRDNHAKIEQFPAAIAIPVKAYLASGYDTRYLGPRNPVVYNGIPLPRFKKIILIVDESIRSDYLQINAPSFDNTPYLAQHAAEYVNFGTAISYANCSATSRLMLRVGKRMQDFPDPGQGIMHQPAIWQYAKRAGMRTVSLDAWFKFRPQHSFLSPYEMTQIDYATDVDTRSRALIDDLMAEKLKQILNEPEATFVLLQKFGIHPPYSNGVRPSLGYVAGDNNIPNKQLSSDRKENVRQYSNAIFSRVDRFFAILGDELNRPDVLAIYTSDHGQAMYDGGYDATHCTGKNATLGESLVPMLVFTGNPEFKRLLVESKKTSLNLTDHEDIFGTLLIAMGFDPSKTQPAYNSSLLSVQTDRRRFFVFGGVPLTDATHLYVDR